MPLPPFPPSWAQDPPPVRATVDERVVVTARRQVARMEDRSVRFEGEVVAVYGVTTVRAERITFYLPPIGSSSGPFLRRAVAEGNVRIEDPLGKVGAGRFEFDWESGTGSASAVALEMADLELSADVLAIQPARWLFTGVQVRPCGDGSIRVRLDELQVIPGQEAVGRNVSVHLGGSRAFGLRRYTMSLDERRRGLPMPSVSVRPNAGLGVSWDPEYRLDPATTLSADVDLFQRREASASLRVTRSFLHRDRGRGALGPRSETAEPFTYGYFEHVGVDDPEQERDALRRERLSLSLGTAWNIGRNDEVGGEFSKPIEVIAEAAGESAGWGWLGQARLQRIERGSADDAERLVTLGILSPPPVRLGSGIQLVGRLDARANQSRERSHGWVRGQVGAVWNPGDRFRFGVAFSDLARFGQPQFSFDEPLVGRSFHVRADAGLGATRVSALAKYDPHGRGWYDHEYLVSQAAGCFLPYAMWREKPSRFSFGILLRPLKKIEKLKDDAGVRLPGNRLPPNPSRD